MNPFRTILWLLLLVPAHTWAQMQFVAKSDKYRVGKDEDFTITLSLNGSGQDLELPPLDDFLLLSGPNKSFATSIVNNRISQELSFSLVLRPRKTGTLQFGSARIRTAEGVLASKPLEIEALAVSPRSTDPNNPQRIASDNAFFRAEYSKTNPVLGEPVLLSLVLYVSNQVNIGQPQIEEIPDFPGLYQKDIELKEVPRGEAVVEGVRYRTFTLMRKILIPQQAGTIKLKPFVYQLPTEVPTNRRDIFGRRYMERVNQLLQVTPPALVVKEPPVANRPADYKGATGNYTLTGSLSRTTVAPNQSVTLTYSLSGTGNVPLVNLPAPALPQELEQYDPEFKESVAPQGSTFSGKKVMEIVVVPRYPGTYKIPAVAVPYFNPSTNAYAVATAPELELVVEGDGTTPITSGPIASQPVGKEVDELDQDIRYIRTAPDWNATGATTWSWAPVLGGMGWLCLAAALLWLLLRQLGLGPKKDPKKELLSSTLKALEAAKGQDQAVILHTLENQLRGLQLSLKFENTLSADASSQWRAIWNQLEQARYMPLAAADAEQLRAQALRWIQTHLS